MEDIEKGVETAELWVERLRIAAVEHYSKHHVPQDLKMQKKTVDYVKQNITQSGSVSSEDQDLNQSPINDEPMVNQSTMFENHRKSRIQHCERSELRLHFKWTKVNKKCQKWSILASF